MLLNHIKTSLRNLWKNKTYSGLNLVGLTLGTACCLYILLYVRDQFSYDGHHRDAKRIFRIVSDLGNEEGMKHFTATSSPPIAPTLARDFPEVADWTRLVRPPEVSHHILKHNNRSFYETNGYYVDSTFFRFFDYRFVAGQPQNCLDEPYSVVLTQAVAQKLFGVENCVGQTIRIENNYGNDAFKITGVVDETWGKSHIDGHFYMAMNSGGIGEYVRENAQFGGQNFIYGYIKVRPGTRAGALAQKLPAFLERYGGAQMQAFGMKKKLHIEPLADIHTRSAREYQLTPTVRAAKLYVLLIIAGFIQFIACINFMNLTTARSTRRAREVGVRKVLGAGRSTLIGQFLTESMILAGMAILMAAPLIAISLPGLNTLASAAVKFDITTDYGFGILLLGLVAGTGLVAGSYPALYLAGFQPALVLKGLSGRRLSAAGMRRLLVVGQFAIAIVLMIGTIVVNRQLNFLEKTDLGFERGQKIIVPLRTEASRAHLVAFKSAVGNLAEVQSVAGVRNYPGQPIVNDFNLYTEGQTMQQSVNLPFTYCDAGYLNTLGLTLLYGRPFTPADTSNQVILNESAARLYGFTPETAVGKRLFREEDGAHSVHEIIGVIRDYHHESLYTEIKPFAYYYLPEQFLLNAIIAVKIRDYAAVMPKIETCWKKSVPGVPFEYSYLDEDLQKQYATDRSLARIVSAFTGMALFISCLGLFGLSVFIAEQRLKEIGVRKVLGASLGNLVALLSMDFVRLVLYALAVAVPFSLWAARKWLQGFAIRIDPDWWIFALAGGLAVLVAFLTVSIQSLRAALYHPAKSLHSE